MIKTLLSKILIITLLFLWSFSNFSPILGMATLIFSLALGLYTIFEKHKQTKNSRINIAKDVLIFITIFLLISFLGGLAGLFANHYASPRFGAVAGFVSAIAASFTLALSLSKGGYLVNRGVGKIFKG